MKAKIMRFFGYWKIEKGYCNHCTITDSAGNVFRGLRSELGYIVALGGDRKTGAIEYIGKDNDFIHIPKKIWDKVKEKKVLYFK